MANASGFVDFNTYADLNEDDEARMMEEAYQRAAQADEAARLALGRAGQDASAKYGTDGQLQDGTELSKTASYSDYLKASEDAKKAWAQVFRDGSDPRTAALRERLRGKTDATGRMAASMSDLEAREAAQTDRLGREAVSIKGQREALAARQAAEQAARDERAKEFEEARAKYVQAMADKAKGRAAAGGAQLNFVGGYNPYADSKWAQQQGGWEAQMIANAGGTDAQQKAAWDAYTGKGRFGGQLTAQHQQRSMTPYAPPKPKEEE